MSEVDSEKYDLCNFTLDHAKDWNFIYPKFISWLEKLISPRLFYFNKINTLSTIRKLNNNLNVSQTLQYQAYCFLDMCKSWIGENKRPNLNTLSKKFDIATPGRSAFKVVMFMDQCIRMYSNVYKDDNPQAQILLYNYSQLTIALSKRKDLTDPISSNMDICNNDNNINGVELGLLYKGNAKNKKIANQNLPII